MKPYLKCLAIKKMDKRTRKCMFAYSATSLLFDKNYIFIRITIDMMKFSSVSDIKTMTETPEKVVGLQNSVSRQGTINELCNIWES